MRTCSVDVLLASPLQASPTASLGRFDEKTETWREWVGVGLPPGYRQSCWLKEALWSLSVLS